MSELAPPPADAPLILVADDVPANVELLFDQLHVLGFRAVAAYDGPAALRVCAEQHPDLCILDVSMPAGDLGVDDRSTGFEVCRRIKRDPRTARIPVIFVTALNDTTDRVKAIEAGGDDFLTKPHNRLVLGARVRSLLKLKAATDALEESLRKQKELEKVRDDLMKMIVHDLKSPLTSMIGAMEMLVDGDFGPLTDDAAPRPRRHGEPRAGPAVADRGSARGRAAGGDAPPAASRAARARRRCSQEVVARVGDPRAAGAARGSCSTSHDDAPSRSTPTRRCIKRVFSNLIQNALTHSARAVTRHARRARRGRRHAVHRGRRWRRDSARVSRHHLPQVRAGEDAAHPARAELGARARLLQARRRGARRPHLGEERPERQGSAFHFWLPPTTHRASAASIAGGLAS